MHEKMFNFTNHQRKINQNHNEISYPSQNGYHEKRQEITNAGGDVEKWEVLYTVGQNVNYYSQYRKQQENSSES